MKEKDHSEETTTPREKTVLITVTASAEDGERIKQAFAQGKLIHLGITEIKVVSTEEPDPKKKQWGQAERRKSGNSRDDGTPPL